MQSRGAGAMLSSISFPSGKLSRCWPLLPTSSPRKLSKLSSLPRRVGNWSSMGSLKVFEGALGRDRPWDSPWYSGGRICPIDHRSRMERLYSKSLFCTFHHSLSSRALCLIAFWQSPFCTCIACSASHSHRFVGGMVWGLAGLGCSLARVFTCLRRVCSRFVAPTFTPVSHVPLRSPLTVVLPCTCFRLPGLWASPRCSRRSK